jgi:hypothetical protein
VENPNLSEFGNLVRQLRIDAGTFLLDHARYLNMKPADLSAMEMDKRKVPEQVVETSIAFFRKHEVDTAELEDYLEREYE